MQSAEAPEEDTEERLGAENELSIHHTELCLYHSFPDTANSPSSHVERGPVQLSRAAPGYCHPLYSSVVADGLITLTLGRLFPDFTQPCHPEKPQKPKHR